MTTEEELRAAVEAAFVVTGAGHPGWDDPHPDRSPLDEEYSRLTDPARYRILGARADAWFVALAELGLADVERDVDVDWTDGQLPVISSVARATPVAAGALPLVIARSQLGDVPDAGVVIGVGDPAACLRWNPDCGCDACDSGSANDLWVLDRDVLGVVTGVFRRLTRGTRTITAWHDGWSATGEFTRGEVEAILLDAHGWTELRGATWLGEA